MNQAVIKMKRFCHLVTLSSLLLCGPANADYLSRPMQDDIVYFVLADRFENGDTANDTGFIPGGPLEHGFDPNHKGFYHGGDLKGLTQRLDYLQNLGVTAIWLAPIFKNKPVQGEAPHISAGYHGYWIQDFTIPDPHLGTPDDFKRLVDEAHKRDMKVIMDVVTNHTADIISYRECHDPTWPGEKNKGCPYRSISEFPYTQHQKKSTINTGFISDQAPHQTYENFKKITRFDYAYTPYIANPNEKKTPDWLNDVRYYHNRGETTFEGENSFYGDFAGLDDLFTEHPHVVEGFIDIYKRWITQYKIDGFRVDTVRHVNTEFWQAFAPAILEHAKSQGIPNFYLFGEVYEFDAAKLAKFTKVDQLPAVLDFAFQDVIRKIASGTQGPSILSHLLQHDQLYNNAQLLPTFTGNHDMGRIGHFLYTDIKKLDKKQALKRSILAHSLMILSRGVPVIYYGDEQGFTGDGHDQDARENLFPSKVASYNDNTLIGSHHNTSISNFDTKHPIYQELAKLNALYQQEIALRRGTQELVYASNQPGLLIFKRTYANETIWIMANTSTQKIHQRIPLQNTTPFQALHGNCPELRGETYQVSISSITVAVCKPL